MLAARLLFELCGGPPSSLCSQRVLELSQKGNIYETESRIKKDRIERNGQGASHV
jgi:hypothetical protein